MANSRGDTSNPGKANYSFDCERRAGTANRGVTRDDPLEGNSKLGDKVSPSSYSPDVPLPPKFRAAGG